MAKIEIVCACGCGQIKALPESQTKGKKNIYFSRECKAKMERADGSYEMVCVCGCGQKKWIPLSQNAKYSNKFYSLECRNKYEKAAREKAKTAEEARRLKQLLAKKTIDERIDDCLVRIRGNRSVDVVAAWVSTHKQLAESNKAKGVWR